MGNAISIKDLSKRYGKNWALSDISFDIDEGEVCALVGENGAGKSTLIDILLGLLKATKGSISFSASLGEQAWQEHAEISDSSPTAVGHS